MLYSHIESQLGAVRPPAQPDMILKSREYQQVLLRWHPTSMKNLALFSQFTTRADVDRDLLLYPDGCVKFIFDCSLGSPRATISGIYSEIEVFKIKPDTTYFVCIPYCFKGLRCKVRNPELMNTQVDFSDVLPEESITEKIAACGDFYRRIDVFFRYADRYLIDDTYSTDFTEYSAVLMCLSAGNVRINDLEEDLGYSEGYIRTKFRQEFGISPKLYSRILRFQNVLHMLNDGEQRDISRIAHHSGYFDQTHFIKEFKRFTSRTPIVFSNSYIQR